MATQCEKTLKHLQSGATLTQDEAKKFYGIARLAARVDDLKKQGYAINSVDIKVPTRDGYAWVAQYSMDARVDQ